MKKTTIKKIEFQVIVILFIFVLSTLRVSAQKPKHEFSIYGEGGFAAFCFKPKPTIKNASSIGYGGDSGLGFTGFISPNWGIHFDVGVGFFNVKNSVKRGEFITPNLENCGYSYDLYTTLNDYKETHKAISLTVPLMLQFQTHINQSLNRKQDKKVGFYAMTGVKAQFLFNYSYISNITSYNNAAYYSEFNNWITELPFLGLGTFDGSSASGKHKFSILTMFALETGAKWHIGKNVFLYTGVYFDYGLHDPTKKMRYSNYAATDLTLLEFANKMNLMMVGIKLRFAFLTDRNKLIPCPYSNLTPKKNFSKVQQIL